MDARPYSQHNLRRAAKTTAHRAPVRKPVRAKARRVAKARKRA